MKNYFYILYSIILLFVFSCDSLTDSDESNFSCDSGLIKFNGECILVCNSYSERFMDLDGNGQVSENEFIDCDTLYTEGLDSIFICGGEPFIDDNLNEVWDIDENYLDVDLSGSYSPPSDLWHPDSGNGVWNYYGKPSEFLHTDNDKEVSLCGFCWNVMETSGINIIGGRCDTLPDNIDHLVNLENLTIAYNPQLSGPIPESIGNLSELDSLNLQYNNLSGSIPESIGNLSGLKYLNLVSNNLSGSIPKEIGTIDSLNYLNLRLNQLSGLIPAEIGDLNNLNDLRLEYNQLSGAIPSELGDMNLVKLFLSHNQLSGNIPYEIGDINSLEYLWLNNNQLSGEISQNICDLTIDWADSNEVDGNKPFSITNNGFCPPYPDCIQDYMEIQDTINCPN